VGLGARVLVIGAGPIGLSVTAFARAAGARAVVVSERNETRRALAARMGATATLAGPEAPAAAFAEAAGGPPDVIFDCVGAPGLIQTCIDASRPRGQIVVVGVLMNPDTIVPISGILKEIDLQFVLGYLEEDFGLVLDALARGAVDARPMISDVVTLDALPGAFEALRTPSTQVKVLIRPGA
jgi:(R,R)-butanediol dehydrogenase/meso-butanediol dehydrogenase/diacetyl reductase